MVRPLLLLFAFLSLAPAALACNLAPAERPSSVSGYVELASSCLDNLPSPARVDPSAEEEFAAKINAARGAAGLAPLTVRTELLPAARFHSLDQIWNGTFGHDGAAGRIPGERIAALDRTLLRSFSAENVAQASGDYNPEFVPRILHNGLMNSPGHRTNILSPHATHMAVGVVRLRDAWVVTQLFVAREGQLESPAPTAMDRVGQAEIGATLLDWTLHGLDSAPVEETATFSNCQADCPVPNIAQLRAEGRRPLENGRGYRSIFLGGPSFDAHPAPSISPGEPPAYLPLRGSSP